MQCGAYIVGPVGTGAGSGVPAPTKMFAGIALYAVLIVSFVTFPSASVR